MKKINIFSSLLLVAVVLLGIESCDREPGCTDANATNFNVNARVDNGTCQYDVTFYFDQNGPNATVNINNQSGTITENYQTGAPACGINALGCANFSLPIGTYSYSATSALTSWTGGSVIVNGGGCQDVLLQQSTGSVTFFTENPNLGTVTINMNGGTASYSGYFNGIPLCGASGAATFNLQPGTYAYTASSTSGSNWNSTVTVTADGCQTIQF